MGMFDYVNTGKPVPCPGCGELLTDFQSKDGHCLMDTIPWHQVFSFYTTCQNCGAWVEYVRDRPDPDKLLFPGYTRRVTTRGGTNE